MIAAMLFYVCFSAWLGPALMKNRAPFVLRRAMLFYNISTVLMNTYFFIMSVYYLRFGLELFNFKFPSKDPTTLTEVDIIKADLVYFYILTKLYDLLDTIFFVLRKKDNQITGEHRIAPLSETSSSLIIQERTSRKTGNGHHCSGNNFVRKSLNGTLPN